MGRSAGSMEAKPDKSDCECKNVKVILNNDVLQTQSSRQGIYEKSSDLVNGKTSWTSDSQAIWYVSDLDFWCIGALDAIGKRNFYFKFHH